MKREYRSKKKTYRLGNRGSTFIVVMVAMCFLAVLGTIIISVSAANVQMKNQDHVSKRNFYTDEQGLDDIYHGIGQVAADCLAQAYSEILARSSADGAITADTYANQEAAYQAFSIRFVDGLEAVYGDEDQALAALENYATKPDPAVDMGTNPGEISVEELDRIEIIDDENGIPFQFIFRDVKVTFETTDQSGAEGAFISSITTDIVIEVPYVNFFQDSSRVLEYAMVANEGIYFRDSGGRRVIGNVYAGVDDPSDQELSELQDYHGAGINVAAAETGVYGGLNFFNANVTFESPYLITKGDMNLRDSVVTVGGGSSSADPQIWAESIRTLQSQSRWDGPEPSTLTINGDIYVANDLELNAENSIVTLAGNYFGYNAGDYRTWEDKGLLADKYDDPVHTRHSAMIINGNGSELDITGLETLVLSGMAYVDMADRPAGDNYGLLPGLMNSDLIEEYATGESLSLRANQYIYLAPSQFLTVPNPVKVDGSTPALADVWVSDSTDTPVSFFGNLFGVASDDPVVERDMVDRETGDVYRYYYLNFNGNELNMSNYAGFIMNMPTVDQITTGNVDSELNQEYGYTNITDNVQWLEALWEIREELQARTGLSGITVEGVDTVAKIHSRGSLANVTRGVISSPVIPDDQRLSLEYVVALQASLFTHYISLYTALDPQEGVSLLNPAADLEADFVDPYTLEQSANDELPAQQFVNFTEPGGLSDANLSNTIFDDYRDTNNQRIVANGDRDVVLSSSFSGIILCDCDVVIEDGVDVNGMIITSGKIYVEGNGTIMADRGAVQSILNEEMREESMRGAAALNNPTADFALTYMNEINLIDSGSATDYSDRIRGTDYVDYISFENWRKG